MNSAKRDARRAETAEGRCKALALRKAGATYDQIAQQLGLSGKSSARRSVNNAIKQIISGPAEEVRLLELERLDAMLLGCWSKAKAGDPQMIDRALRIMERRAAYLGLDAPKKTLAAFDAALEITEGAHEALLGRIASLVAATRDDS